MYDIAAYYPHTAQKKYLLQRSCCHQGMFWNEKVISCIEDKLRATWPPEQIACTPCGLPIPSWRTFYRWIYEKYLVNGNLKVLRRKGKSHGVKENRGSIQRERVYKNGTKAFTVERSPVIGRRTPSSAVLAKVKHALSLSPKERHGTTFL